MDGKLNNYQRAEINNRNDYSNDIMFSDRLFGGLGLCRLSDETSYRKLATLYRSLRGPTPVKVL